MFPFLSEKDFAFLGGVEGDWKRRALRPLLNSRTPSPLKRYFAVSIFPPFSVRRFVLFTPPRFVKT